MLGFFVMTKEIDLPEGCVLVYRISFDFSHFGLRGQE
jgi:hypothetical protein